MTILFITRNFPPKKGGLERVAFYLYSYLRKNVNVILLKWGGSKFPLFFILPYFLLKSFWILITRKIDIIYLNEGFLSILGVILRLFKISIVITIHGLDITYENGMYQFIIPKCVSLLNKVICISQATKEECIKRRISGDKISVIPDGFEDEFYIDKEKEILKEELSKRIDLKLENKKILISVCRLVERKGIHWFINEVIPLISEEFENYIYIIAGDGPMFKYIENVIYKRDFRDHVILLGEVDDEILKLFYNIADVFVMPNIPVKGNIEGFGLVILEASSCKLPVIASDLEGIRDASLNGKAAILVPPLNREAFREGILRLLTNDSLRYQIGEKSRKLVLENFTWDRTVEKYLKLFRLNRII